MTTDRSMHASDQDRESAVALIRDAYTAGRLRPEEFGERIDAAYAATTWGELDDLTADLPLASTDDGLPAQLVTSQGRPGRVTRARFRKTIVVCLIATATGLAIGVSMQALWTACAIVPLVLLLPLALGRLRAHPEAVTALPRMAPFTGNR